MRLKGDNSFSCNRFFFSNEEKHSKTFYFYTFDSKVRLTHTRLIFFMGLFYSAEKKLGYLEIDPDSKTITISFVDPELLGEPESFQITAID